MALAAYMDVHVPSAVTEGLRRRGVDVLTSQEDGTREADDETLLQRAADLNRVLVSQDDDLLAIAAAWQDAGREFTGVVYAHQLGPGIGELIDDLELLLLCAEPMEVHDRVTYAAGFSARWYRASSSRLWPRVTMIRHRHNRRRLTSKKQEEIAEDAHCSISPMAGNSGRVTSSRRAGKLREHFGVFREAVDFVLREDHLAVDDDVEDPAAAFDELRVDAGLGFDLFRQTGGCGQVVSLHAVSDRNLHQNLRGNGNCLSRRLWRNRTDRGRVNDALSSPGVHGRISAF